MTAIIQCPVTADVKNPSSTLRIEVVPRSEKHTLVVQSGAWRLCLRFNETITGSELTSFIHEQYGHDVSDLTMVTNDGEVIEPQNVPTTELVPGTETVTFDECKTTTVEFRRKAPSKG